MSDEIVGRLDDVTRRLREALDDMHTAAVDVDRDAYLEARGRWVAADEDYRAIAAEVFGE